MEQSNKKPYRNLASALNRLNTLFADYRAAHNRYLEKFKSGMKQATAKAETAGQTAEKAGRKFDEFRATLPRTKFDMVADEYFYAEDDGQEVFAVKVSKTKSCVLRLPARNAEAARAMALEAVAYDPSVLTKSDVSAEIVSR